MADVLTVREAVNRAKSEGLQISESALRRWIKSGQFPVRLAGKKALIFYPGLADFLRCSTGGDNQPATVAKSPGIRRLEVRP